MMSFALLFALAVEVVGSLAGAVLAGLATLYAWRLNRLNPGNFLWDYLFYVTAASAGFALARVVGHMAPEILTLFGREDIWAVIAPWAGGFNTLFMVAMAAVMLFFHKGVQSYDAVEAEARLLKESQHQLAATASELKALNTGLELIVEKRAAQQAKAEKRFRHFFRDSNDIIFFSGPDGKIEEMNPAGLKKLQRAADEVSELSLKDLFDPVRFADFQKAMERRGYLHDYEIPVRKQDGSMFAALLSTTALYAPDGRFTGMEHMVKDLSAMQSLLAQLVAQEKLASLGQMAAGIAHEINTPLGIILGYAQLMMDDFPKESEHYRNLAVIERQTRYSREIVKDLLNYARQSGNLRLPVQLNVVVQEVLSMAQNIHGPRVARRVDLAPELPMITGDAVKLKQVILNLVKNACQSMEAQGGGVLALRSFVDGSGMVCLEIRDTGSGIAEEDKAHIFDPFFTTKAQGQGTGLGLSVTYGIVREHGGLIAFESPAPVAPDDPRGMPLGPGTSFLLRFPEAVEKEEENGPPNLASDAHLPLH